MSHGRVCAGEQLRSAAHSAEGWGHRTGRRWQGECAVDALMVTVLMKSYTCFGLDKQLAKILKGPHRCLGGTSWTIGLVEVDDSVDRKASWNRSVWTCPSPWNWQEELYGLVWPMWALTLVNRGVVSEWWHWAQKDIEHHVNNMTDGNSHCSFFFLFCLGEKRNAAKLFEGDTTIGGDFFKDNNSHNFHQRNFSVQFIS